MLFVRDREVMIHDRKRIAVGVKSGLRTNALLLGIQFSAQRNIAVAGRIRIHGAVGAAHPVGNVTDENVEPTDSYRTCLRAREAFDAPGEQRPCSHLPFKQIL